MIPRIDGGQLTLLVTTQIEGSETVVADSQLLGGGVRSR